MTTKPLILMIDDNVGDHLLIHEAFADAKREVEIRPAYDGALGITALQEMVAGRSPMCRLVLLDLNLPRVDGRSVLSWARLQPQLATLPIFILTSSDRGRDREQCIAAGATGFLMKPAKFVGYFDIINILATYLVPGRRPPTNLS
jgi:CheY-like chemotaxis protein